MKRNRILMSLALIGVTAAASMVSAAGATRGQRAEIRFLEGMSDHHQMAVDMANDCLAKAHDETLLALCQNIIDAQSAEIAQMQGWLRDWYEVDYAPVPMTAATAEPGMGGMDMGSMNMSAASDPPMTMGMMAGLNALEGRDYEIAWVESMIDHHDDALHMAARVLRSVEHDDLRRFANQIIYDQSAEIQQMERLLEKLST